MPSTEEQLVAQFRAAAVAVALARPEVDADIARELMFEAAVLLHNSLALDSLSEADTAVVVSALAADLTAGGQLCPDGPGPGRPPARGRARRSRQRRRSTR